MKTNECGKSLVNVIPRNNGVLIRMEFKVSLMAITSGKPEEDSSQPVTYTVAGIGPLVKDLDLNEKVTMKLQAEYVDIVVKGNNRSVRKLTEFYKDTKNVTRIQLNELMGNAETAYVDAVQYGIFPEFQIMAHDTDLIDGIQE
jgi:hypothetical protein